METYQVEGKHRRCAECKDSATVCIDYNHSGRTYLCNECAGHLIDQLTFTVSPVSNVDEIFESLLHLQEEVEL